MKSRVILILLGALFGAHSCLAQDEAPEEKTGFDKSKLFVGGNFGLSFGDYTIVNVSPQVGYRFNQFLAAGAGVNFLYSSIKYRNNQGNSAYKAAYGVTGLNLFGRVYPIEQILLQVQPEMNYTWGKYKYYDGQPNEKNRRQIGAFLLLGGGAVIPSGRGAFIAMVQFDVLNNARSPYGSRPIFNFGYNIGF